MSQKKNVKLSLSAKWMLDASLLSRPVDLTSLVTLSKNDPLSFLNDDTVHRLVSILLNEPNFSKSDKDTKLDVLNILANIASVKRGTTEVKLALQGVSEWFDDFLSQEESQTDQEPELHKSMVLLLARCWEYKLKTDDVLELTQGNRRIALCTVVGLLEDGETYSTELRQRQKPGENKLGQWEHELVRSRYEKPLLLQICRLLRGFTHPGTYFETSSTDIALYSVEKFAIEIDCLLDITMHTGLLEKLSSALYNCLFEQIDDEYRSGKINQNEMLMDVSDHTAVICVHNFLQNLYFYATQNNEVYRHYLLEDTLLIPRLILPYLNKSIQYLNNNSDIDDVYSELVRGMAASLRTLILATFVRAPYNQFMMLLAQYNPTIQILNSKSFCIRNEYIYSLLCLLNVNIGTLKSSSTNTIEENAIIENLLFEFSSCFSLMDKEKQLRVCKRVMYSGALPVKRDTESYATIVSVLHNGGSSGNLSYLTNTKRKDNDNNNISDEDDKWLDNGRAEAKKENDYILKLQQLKGSGFNKTAGDPNRTHTAESKHSHEPSAFEIATVVASAGNARLQEFKNTSRDTHNKTDIDKDKFGLLGNLPSLNGNISNENDIQMALKLRLPEENHNISKTMMSSESKNPVSFSASVVNSSIPKQFLCCINGHVMKDPVKAKSGEVFERATIDVWITSNGNINPITFQPLFKEDLKSDEELRNKIKRYHIEKTRSTNTNPEDDLYDF